MLLLRAGVRRLNRPDRMGSRLVARADGGLHIPDQRRDIVDGHDPLRGVRAGRFSPQPELDRAVGKGGQLPVPFGVPLDEHVTGLERVLPGFPGGVLTSVEVRGDGVGQHEVESFPSHVDGQNLLLIGLPAPPGAVHHPEEGRLDPGRSRQFEGRNEALGLDGWLCNPRRVGLVDPDPRVREQRADLPFRRRGRGGVR